MKKTSRRIYWQSNHNCCKCSVPTGTKILCENCRVGLSKYEIEKYDKIFQQYIVNNYGSCVNCDHTAEFSSGELCADHIEPKGAYPSLRYDLDNAACRCAFCHVKRHKGLIDPDDFSLHIKVESQTVLVTPDSKGYSDAFDKLFS